MGTVLSVSSVLSVLVCVYVYVFVLWCCGVLCFVYWCGVLDVVFLVVYQVNES